MCNRCTRQVDSAVQICQYVDHESLGCHVVTPHIIEKVEERIILFLKNILYHGTLEPRRKLIIEIVV